MLLTKDFHSRTFLPLSFSIGNFKQTYGLSNPPLGVQTTKYYKMIISVSDTTNSTDALT